MRHLKLLVGYDGTAYHGSQRQKNAGTVQEVLEKAAGRLLKEKVRLRFAGRTDAGVHAEGQVANFSTRRKIPLRGLQEGLNAVLPKDIVVRSITQVPSDFHPRFDACRKEYRYTIWNSAVPTPFLRHYALHVPQPLDLAAMRKAARLLVGRRDFKSFQASDRRERSSVRTLQHLSIRKKGPLVEMTFQGDGFVYRMVRNIVGTLLEVGRGRRTSRGMEVLLKRRRRALAGPTAPARGLCLVSVRYSP